MHKVYQSIISADRGDCLRATVASILDLELNEVPDFNDAKNWVGLIDHVFESMKYQRLEWLFYWNENFDQLCRLHEFNGIDGLFLASVYSPKFFDPLLPEGSYQVTHSVIIDKNFKVIHDPNPNYGLEMKYPGGPEKYNGIINVMIYEKRK